MYQRILVPIDGSETARHGLEEAIRLAKLTQGQLRLFHVIDDLSFALALDSYAGHPGDWQHALREEGSKLLEDGKRAAEAAGVQADGVLQETFNGRVCDLVAAEARQWPADLIVVGTHGRRGISRVVLGSGAESILRSAPVPVLLARLPEAAAPQDQPAKAVSHVSVPTAGLKFE